MAKSQEEKTLKEDRGRRAMSTIDDARYVTGELRQSELLVTPALTELLEPGDRRFIALGWASSFCVYDGWTEYTLNLSPQDVFGDGWGMLSGFMVENLHHGCESCRILIDFTQGTIHVGDEECVERLLDEVVDER